HTQQRVPDECACTRDLDVSAGGSPARCTSRCAERGITEFLTDALRVKPLPGGGYHAEEELHRPDHHRARERNREDQGSRGCSVGDVWRPERRHPDSDRRRLVVCREQRRGATVHSTGGAPFVLCRFSSYVRGSRSVDEVDLHLVRDETRLIALVQEELDRAPAVRTV